MSRTNHGAAPSSWQYSLKASVSLFVSAIVIATGFYVIHSMKIDDSLSNTKLITEVLFEHENGESEQHIEHLKQKASALLKLRHIHAIALIDQNGEPLFSEGIGFSRDVLQKIRSGEMSVKKGHLLSYVYVIDKGNPESYRLLVEMDLHSESLINLQFLFLCTVVLIGIFAVTIYINRRLTTDIFEPLEELNDELSKNNNIGLMVPIKLRNNGIYGELIQQTNESFSIQTEKSEEFKKSIEVATKELRESLETVEIQNIDLDIARKNAVELNKLKSEFLKKTSQDLLPPLQGILSFVELIQNYRLNADQKEYLSTIEDSTRGMIAIVNDVNDFAKLEAGKLQLEQKPFDLRHTIESTLTLQAPAAVNADVTLYSTFDSKLPSAVMGDPLRVQQVVSNLIANAIKFDKAGYVYVRAELFNQSKNEINITIRIQTDGLCPSELELWQDHDFDVENIGKTLYSRAGMSLIVAKGLSQHMNGSVSFESDKDLRIFTLELKCSPTEEQFNEPKAIDPSYKINAIVFSNNDTGYREIASRLSELSIKTHRATNFPDIITLAKRLCDNRQKHARYLPIAVVEAQTSHQALDKIMLTQTLKTVVDELKIPSMVIAPSGKHESLQKTLAGLDLEILQHPVITARFRSYLLELLGIVKLQSESSSSITHSELKPIKILVVEDNLANIKLSKALLADFNVETSVACSGSEALGLAKQQAFDLIFMDIELPDINGYEATKLIREHEPQNKRVPIVALTAHDVSAEKSQLLLAGMDDVIGKPLTTKDISTILDRWVIGTLNNVSTPEKKDATDYSLAASPSNSSQEASPVNISESLKLSKNNPDLAKDMLSMLLKSLTEERIKINLSAIESDLGFMYETIHKLHGACCYCGVPRLRNITKTLDMQLKNRDETRLIENLEEFYSAADELLDWQESHDIDALFD